MLKVKINTKILVILLIMLIAMFILNINTVNAKEITEEELQAMLDVIPNEIALDIPEIDCGEKADKLIEEKVKKILQDNNMQVKEIEIDVYGTQLIFQDIHKTEIFIQSKNIMLPKSKKVSILYNTTKKINKVDEQYVKNIMTKIEKPRYLEVGLDFFKNIEYDNVLKVLQDYYTNLINDNSVVVKAEIGSRRWRRSKL